MTDSTRMAEPMAFMRLASVLLLGSALALLPMTARAQDDATAAPTASEAAPSPQTVLATVGDEEITEADLAFAAEDVQDNLAQVPPADRRAFLLSVVIDMKLMAQAARDAKLDEAEPFQRRMSYLEDSALRRAYFSNVIANGVDEAALKSAYDSFVADFTPEEEVHARHILVATEDEAKAVEDELANGKPFEMVAMDKTTDPSGKQNGGDLGFFTKEMMVPEFAEAAFALEPGEISAPVESKFGWHVIKLEEKRMTQPPTLEQLTPQLGQQAMYAAYDSAIADLRKTITVAIPDADLAAGVDKLSQPADAASEADASSDAEPAAE